MLQWCTLGGGLDLLDRILAIVLSGGRSRTAFSEVFSSSLALISFLKKSRTPQFLFSGIGWYLMFHGRLQGSCGSSMGEIDVFAN